MKTYLGDGLYADYDGMHFILSTQRESGIHYVGLEDLEVLPNFLKYVEKTLGVKIEVTKLEPVAEEDGS